MSTRQEVAGRSAQRTLALALLMALPLLVGLVATASAGGPPTPQASGMYLDERLAEPVLLESPTPVDTGRYLYYHHCMPCHGDRGQGLTDEWREVWVDDHQNCWGRGCHNGRPESAFRIPRRVPAVVGGSGQALTLFDTAEDLYVFLRETQPPQRAGTLADDQYWALTAFLLDENGRPLPAGLQGQSAALAPGPRGVMVAVAVAAGVLLLLAATPWAWKRGRRSVSSVSWDGRPDG